MKCPAEKTRSSLAMRTWKLGMGGGVRGRGQRYFRWGGRRRPVPARSLRALMRFSLPACRFPGRQSAQQAGLCAAGPCRAPSCRSSGPRRRPTGRSPRPTAPGVSAGPAPIGPNSGRPPAAFLGWRLVAAALRLGGEESDFLLLRLHQSLQPGDVPAILGHGLLRGARVGLDFLRAKRRISSFRTAAMLGIGCSLKTRN